MLQTVKPIILFLLAIILASNATGKENSCEVKPRLGILETDAFFHLKPDPRQQSPKPFERSYKKLEKWFYIESVSPDDLPTYTNLTAEDPRKSARWRRNTSFSKIHSANRRSIGRSSQQPQRKRHRESDSIYRIWKPVNHICRSCGILLVIPEQAASYLQFAEPGTSCWRFCN